MTTQAISGYEILLQLQDILGIRGQQVRRVIIDIDINSAVTMYVQRYASQPQVDAAVRSIIDVTSADSPCRAAEKIKGGPSIGKLAAQMTVIETSSMEVDEFGKVTYTRRAE